MNNSKLILEIKSRRINFVEKYFKVWDYNIKLTKKINKA